MNGQGTYTLSDGTKHVGLFKDGYANGQGTRTLANGEIIKGIWRNGELVEKN